MSCACHLLDTFNEKLKHLVEIVITFFNTYFQKIQWRSRGWFGSVEIILPLKLVCTPLIEFIIAQLS